MLIKRAGAGFILKKISVVVLVFFPCLLMVLLAIPSGESQHQAQAATGELLRCDTNVNGEPSSICDYGPATSSDGRYVFFITPAANLVEGDGNGKEDILRKDTLTGDIRLCSTDASGEEGSGDSSNISVSSDGRFVCFKSSSSELVPNDTNGCVDIFRKDLDTGAIVRCSTDSSGQQANSSSDFTAISDDGRYAVFSSAANNLVPNDTNGCVDIFRKDLDTGAIVRCSTDALGIEGNGSSQYSCAISGNGRYAAFTSAANNLVPNDTNGCDDIFRKDLDTGAIVRCSTDATGLQGVSDSGSPVISYDGRYLGFCSRANNLVPSDENGSIYDVFRKDIETGAVVKCSTRADGSDDNNHSRTPSMSSDGRYITFVTTGELVKYPCLYEPYAYRKDVASGEIALCPATNEGIPIEGNYYNARISGSGQYVVFSDVAVYRKTMGIEPLPPHMDHLDQDSGPVGCSVTITGSNFGATKNDSYVKFSAFPATDYTYWSDNKIVFKVPDSMLGINSVCVHTNLCESNSLEFYVGYSLVLAEGYTGPGFQEYLCIGNPNGAEIELEIDYLFGGYYSPQYLRVPACSRITVDVNSIVPDQEVSVYILSNYEIAVERPMYFNYGGGWTGGHDAVASQWISTDWFFAEGYTGPGFDEWICVLNMGDADANLTFHFQTAEEGEVIRNAVVPVASRVSFKVNDLLGPDYSCSLWLESDQYVVAERSMYFDYTGTCDGHWEGGHCVMGLPGPCREFYFAEGTTRAGFEEWLTIQNPNDSAIEVNAVYQMGVDQGDPVTRNYSVEAGQRLTVFVPGEVGMEKDLSIKLSSDAYFLAERPMYFRYSDAWEGGHCVIGAYRTSSDWFFAEGYTGAGFDEWLCLQNPGDKESTVEVTYLTQEAGALPPKTVKIAPHSRLTIRVNSDAGENYQLSTRLRVLDGPEIVAERPMYFDFNGWDGGHDVVGYVMETGFASVAGASFRSAGVSGLAPVPGFIDSLWKKK